MSSGSLWRTQGFRALFFARSASVFGDALLVVALAFAIIDATGSTRGVGYIYAAETLALFLFILLGGVWSDRLPRRLVMVVADVGRFGIQCVAAALFLTGSASIPLLVTLYFFYGCFSALFYPAASAIVPDTVEDAQLQEANATLGAASSMAALIGPGLAGLLVAATSAGTVVAIDAGTFAFSALWTFMIPAVKAAPGFTDASSMLSELRDGWTAFAERRWIWVKSAHWTLYMALGAAPFEVLGPLIAADRLGGAWAWGLIEALFAAGGLIGRYVAVKVRPSRPIPAALAMTFFAAPSLMLLAAGAPAIVIAVSRMATGAALTFYAAAWSTALQQNVPREKLARVSSFEWLTSLTLMPVGYAIAGPIGSVLGASRTLWLSAAWVLASTAVALTAPSIWSIRRPPTRLSTPKAIIEN